MESINLTTELEQACHVLFGREITVSKDFLEQSLQPSGIKKAYRRMALVTHPDSAELRERDISGITFLDVKNAYEQLVSFLQTPSVQFPAPSSPPTTPAKKRTAPRPGDAFRATLVPRRELRIGEFLYYCGVIPLRALIDSITWQQRGRPRFGEIAVGKNLLTKEQIRELVFARAYPEKLGDAAARIGLLTTDEVAAILDTQRIRQRKIGTFFIEREMIDTYHLFYYLHQLGLHNDLYRETG